MVEVMFRHYRAIKYELVGRRNFYSAGGEFGTPYPIGCGKEGVTGFFGSMRPASWKDGSLLLNIDVAHTAFYKEQPLLNFIQDFMNFREDDFHRPLEPFKRSKLLQELRNIRVQVTHSNIPRTYKIIDVSEHSAEKQTFPLKDENTGNTVYCTIENYFKNQYGKKIKFPKLNCVQVSPAERNVFIPFECCKIYKGQRVVKKLSDRETAQFIRTTAVPPATRKKQICNIHRTNDFTQDPMLKNLQFSIAERPLHMEGRILPAPELLMDAPVQPREGVWDARRRSFYRGADINTWVVMNYNPRFVDQRSTETFITKLLHMADEKGMKFSEPVAAFGVWKPCPEQDFTRLKQEYSNLQLVLVILGRGGDLYARIKRTGDTEVGILSQCVQATNVTAIKPQTLGNILLKINAKMGGINNVLSRTGMPMVSLNHGNYFYNCYFTRTSKSTSTC
ncbi:protein argonaute-3-like [Homarus americanus]|nr:protein argonaute-3-like [Homarus americanus]